MKIILLIIIYIQILKFENCGMGCLKCQVKGDTEECIICDSANKYIDDGLTCTKNDTIQNCIYLSQNGECIYCDQNYYIDEETKKCVKVDDSKSIEKCLFYDSRQLCLICEEDFKFQKGRCVTVQSKISNCKYYDSFEGCIQCQDNYILGSDNLCKQGSECSIYNEVQCLECDKGYILNKNYYFYQLFDTQNINKRTNIVKYMSEYYNKILSIQNFSVCQSYQVNFCEDFKTATQCSKCQFGYYVNDYQQCDPYPSAAISFCEIYKSNSVCQKCNQKYLLQNGVCKAGQSIENCTIYDGTTETQVCQECDIDYYLSNNYCLQRTQQNIQNCLTYNKYQDECQTCQGNYVISLEGLKCFEPIEGCDKNGYQSVYSNFDSAKCVQCSDGYYLNENNTCSIGQINNCANYQSQNQCSKCVQGYYLEDGICQQHVELSNCIEYDPNQKNVCLKCNTSTFNFKVQKKCEEFQEISFCSKYSFDDEIQCQECQKNYYLKDGKCSKILINKCETFNNTTRQCIKCEEQYGLYNNKCYKAYDFITENCLEVDYQQNVKDVNCIACEKDTEPLKMNKRFVCIEDSLLIIKGIEKIQNCLKYKKLEDEQECVQCGNGKYLDNGQCKDNCSQFHRVQVEEEDGIHVHGYNICEADTENQNCQIFSIDINSIQYSKICILCKPESFNFVDISLLSYSNVDPYVTTEPYVISEASIFNSVDCEVKTTLINNEDENIVFKNSENCQYFYDFQYEVIVNSIPTQRTLKSCLRCEFGYTGKIVKDSSTSDHYYINQCTSLTSLTQNSCTDTKYYNLNPLWEKFFTCHLCSTPTQIPVLFVKFKALDDFQSSVTFLTYDEASTTDWTTGNSTTTLKCLDNKAVSFGLSDTSSWFTISQSCALAVMNLQTVDRSQNPGLYKPLFCAACKPGKKALNTNTNQFYITECTDIANCEGKEWFNACSQCKSGYVYKYINNKPDWTQCVQFTNTDNCYSAEILVGGTKICRLCEKGYSLNFDNHCINYQPPKCANSQKFIKDPYFDISIAKYYLYYSQEGIGCSLCQQDYSAVFIESDLQEDYQSGTPEIFIQSCVYTDFFRNYPTNPKIIQYCSSYSLSNGILICKQCASGKVLQQNQSKCVSNLLNCLEADNNQQCSKCEDGYSLISIGDGNECQKGKIENCAEFNSTFALNKQKCSQCTFGYKRVSGGESCVEGNILNCQTYAHEDNQCEECLQGYALIKNKTKDYCYPLATELSCNNGIMQNSNIYGATFSCTTCAKLTLFPKTNTKVETICMPFDVIENCLEYNLDDTLTNSNFQCLQCQKEYYLDINFICKERQTKTDNCKNYKKDKDECEECEDKYFLEYIESGDLKCIEYPDGISGCRVYQNFETCQSCIENMFIFNNSCVQVEDNSIIENCQYYETQTECFQCKTNYIIANEGKECLKITAKNCLEYESYNKCSVCKQGLGLKKNEDGSQDCIEISKQSCEIQSQSEPYSCILCQKDTYQKSGECLNVQNKIQNCIYYENDGICSECEEGFVLLENGSECISKTTLENLISSNCKKAIKNLDLICIGCQPGYYFKNNRCQQCETNLSNGCFACDPLEPSVCFICTIGYQMTKDGKCTKNNNATSTPNQNNETVTESNKMSILFINFLILNFFQLNFQLEIFNKAFNAKQIIKQKFFVLQYQQK